MMWELAILLLPVAAGSGWYMGRSSGTKPTQTLGHKLGSDYYKGLNYLLNEQPDKALDAFIRMLDVNPDTFETTVTLGKFFRRRGEADKAIRIHQNLIAKPNLTSKQRSAALMELAQDYMRAGVYDRAESLLLELLQAPSDQLELSLRHLIDIFEREKDWKKAIVMAKRLQQVNGQYMGKEIAHYHCEIAQLAWSEGKIRAAVKEIKQAYVYDRICVRASILSGNIKKSQGDYPGALKAYKQVQHQDVDFISEVIFHIQYCYNELGSQSSMVNYFDYLLQVSPHISVVLASAQSHKRHHGGKDAARFLADHMRSRPSIRGIRHLVDYHLEEAFDQVRDDLLLLRSLMDKLLENKPTYRCRQCGLATKTLHWQCPSCRQWSSIKPNHRIEGES